jgi:deoxyadenosine/deoxycytidine kinase
MINPPKKGILIALIGIPGSGKSSLCKQLAQCLQAQYFLEPEEEQWPDCVKLRKLVGNYTMLSWFRSIRVTQLYQASQQRENGSHVIIDSYYDKLFYKYMHDKNLAWLIDKKDPYFSALKIAAKNDWHQLPIADILVCMNINLNIWKKFIFKRGRIFDKDPSFQRSYALQTALFKAAGELASITQTKTINFNIEEEDLEANTINLYQIIQEHIKTELI